MSWGRLGGSRVVCGMCGCIGVKGGGLVWDRCGRGELCGWGGGGSEYCGVEGRGWMS